MPKYVIRYMVRDAEKDDLTLGQKMHWNINKGFTIFIDKHAGKIRPEQGRHDRRGGVEEVRQRAQERVFGRPERLQDVLLHHLLADVLLLATQDLCRTQ